MKKKPVKHHKNKQEIVKDMKKKKARKELKTLLQDVYHQHVNLETTMSCKCICCKVAMPQMNYCEFMQIISDIWTKYGRDAKIQLIVNSVKYFFYYDFKKFGMKSLIKPCLLLKQDGLCDIYENRPLSCRMFGLWPDEIYNERVERFAKNYEEFGLTKEDLPLFSQCKKVKRVDDSIALDEKMIENLYGMLDNIDASVSSFSNVQIKHKENYRAFHDWLLLKIFGEAWLSSLTDFIMVSEPNVIEDQYVAMEQALNDVFKSSKMMDIGDRL